MLQYGGPQGELQLIEALGAHPNVAHHLLSVRLAGSSVQHLEVDAVARSRLDVPEELAG